MLTHQILLNLESRARRASKKQEKARGGQGKERLKTGSEPVKRQAPFRHKERITLCWSLAKQFLPGDL
ncbi:MAG: hypothetical protein DMF68_13420 [Acidobacteria bacterium]|nr:MAG: hypothetical protein DMF68_13420 [Acidobacteriota bacterium]